MSGVGLNSLPEDLPRPADGAAARHLEGMAVPEIELPATDGSRIAPARLPSRTVIYCYPKTGRPGVPVPGEWDVIPGARGCTPQSCGFRDLAADFESLGARIFGMSTQDTAYQGEAAERLRLPFRLLSDGDLRFARALRLPTFDFQGETLLKRLAMVLRDGRVEHVFYPVFPPDGNAAEVLGWLAEHPSK